MTVINAMKSLYKTVMGSAMRSVTGRINAVIPIELIEADPLYQRIEHRNEKKHEKLKAEWDYNLMDALIVVAHPETCTFSVVDGLGRLIVAKEKGLEYVDCVIIIGPEDPEARRKFEAQYFLRQALCTTPLRPVDMHNARILVGDNAAIAVENVCNANGVEILSQKGSRSGKKLGSYDRTYRVAKVYGTDVLTWVFDVIHAAGFDTETNGYSGRLVTVLGKFRNAYQDVTVAEIGTFLRTMSPLTFQSRAIAKYPERCSSPEIPMLLFLQDWATDNGKEEKFDSNGKRLSTAA